MNDCVKNYFYYLFWYKSLKDITYTVKKFNY